MDDNGNRLFSDDDIPALSKKAWTALDRIFDVAVGVNKIGDPAIEELEKNSEPGPPDASFSD
jgi:hypothetical protein